MKLSSTQRHVLLQLKVLSKNDQAVQSIQRLANHTGFSRSTIIRALKDLEAHGLITRIHRTDPSDGAVLPNAYRINA
jgi:DNA-binding MarR family transcriptional regulator